MGERVIAGFKINFDVVLRVVESKVGF